MQNPTELSILNPDGTVTVLHRVWLNDYVHAEFQAMLESADDIDITEEPELHEVMDAIANRLVTIYKTARCNGYNIYLTLGAVEAFAREVAYYIEHNIGCRSEGDTHPDINRTINNCRRALSSANQVLTTHGGMPAIKSYFQ